jgi:hypothetical protein
MAASALSAGLQADEFQRLYPAEYFAKFAEQGVRPDGRPLALPRCAPVQGLAGWGLPLAFHAVHAAVSSAMHMHPCCKRCPSQRPALTAPLPPLLHTCCRPTSIGLGVVSTADASALVKMGSTTVLAGVKCEIMPALSEAPDEGRWTLQVGRHSSLAALSTLPTTALLMIP